MFIGSYHKTGGDRPPLQCASHPGSACVPSKFQMSRKLRNTTLGNVGFSLEQMLLKPVASQSGDFFQRTVLFEQMSCAGNNFDFMFGLKFSCGASVQFNDDVI